MKENYKNLIRKINNGIDMFIDKVNGADNQVKIDFRKAIKTYNQLERGKKIMDLDEFCENEAFGYYFCREDDSHENRLKYARSLKILILKEKTSFM